MKKYKLYGIGNALLDYEYKVNDSVLEELGLEKGCMLLNEYDKHFELHKSLKEIRPPEKIIPLGLSCLSWFLKPTEGVMGTRFTFLLLKNSNQLFSKVQINSPCLL